MAEEALDPEEENQEDSENGEESPLDQSAIDAMVQNAQDSDSQADELESLLDDIEDDTDAGETAGGADELEELVDSLEGAGEENADDLLYQATLQDVEGTQPTEEETAPADAGGDEANTTDDELDELDALAAAFDDGDDDESPEEEEEAQAAESDDLDALLSGLDGEEESAENDVAPPEAEATEDVESLLGDLGEPEDEIEDLQEEDEGVEDVDSLLEGLDDTVDAAPEAEASESIEEEEAELGDLLEDLDASAEETATPDDQKASTDVDLLEDLDEEADLGELLEDLDEGAASETSETDEDADVESLLEDLDDDVAAETLEEEERADVGELLENLDDDAAAETLEAEEDADVGELLEDLDDAAGETLEADEDADVGELLEDLDDDAAAETLEAEEDADVGDLLEDLDDDAAGEALEAEEDADVGELLEDLDDDAAAETLEADDDADVGELLEDLDDDAAGETLEADDDADVGDLLEDLDDDAAAETLEMDEDADVGELLEDFDADSPEESLEAEDTTDDAILDLDDLDLDDDTLPDLDLDDDLPGFNEDDPVAASDDEIEDTVESSEADLDSLLDDDSILDDDDELFETDLNVGVEHEVAHMLATGQAAPTEEGEALFEDFASVQASLHGESPEDGGTVLIVDDDQDNVGLFQDALVEGDYTFLEADSAESALSTVQTSDVDIVIVNLDMDDNHGVVVVDRMSDDDTPPIPIIVTSEQSDLIEGALQAGAADHFTRPIGIVDLEYQLPKTVSNLIKLKRAQHVLAGVESPVAGDPTPVVSSDSLDDDTTDDYLLDDDDPFSSDDDDLSFSSSDLLDDDLEEDDDDELPPTARLATGAGSERIYPISDQSKMARERDWSQTRKSKSNLPAYLGLGALAMVLLAGISAMMTMFYINMQEQEVSRNQTIQRPQPVPVLKPPRVQQAGYEVSRARVRQPDDYQRQAESVKSRIRNTVRELEAQEGSWWSPWRVMRQAGGSVGVLVQGRSRDDIIEAFGVDRSAVREGLQSRRTMNYLSGVGFDLDGKDVDDLTSRETFELLSAREIKSQDNIVDVLSRLTDRLAEDKTEQARNKSKRRPSRGTATLTKPVKSQPTEAPSHKVKDPSHAANQPADILQQFGFAIRIPGGPPPNPGSS